MPITIVTDKSYILTNKINSMHVDEAFEELTVRGKRVTLPLYTIFINFEPLPGSNANLNSRDDRYMTVEIKCYGHKRAVSLFKSMVKQIREQCPDQLYLDKIAESFLAGDIEDDPSPEEICFPRKEKRRSKAVLRRAKRGRR